MQDWTAGYVSDIGYTYGYFKELNPLRMRLALLNAGIEPPPFDANSTACELGFGQGLSAVIHAATSETQWFGNDFLPTQALFAQELAKKTAPNAEFTDESFAEFLARDDLPKFDFICLHGVWTWISDKNRALIVKFIEKNLALGGVVYLSYNTQIGWAQIMPLRRLLVEHTLRQGSPSQNTAQKITNSLDYLNELLKTQPLHTKNNPQVAPKLAELRGQDPHYLAHEYFNRDWLPMDFCDLSEQLSAIKLEFAGTANFLDLIDALNLTPEQQNLLANQTDTSLRETSYDFCVDKKFRKDYWIKGARELNQLEVIEKLRAEKIILTKSRGSISLVVEGALGVVDLTADIYNPLLDLLADYKPHSLGELEEKMQPFGIGLQEIVQAVFIFAHRGELQNAQEEETQEAVLEKTQKLNLELIKKARASDAIQYLASPVIGGGLAVNRYSQIFILGLTSGYKTAEELAHFTWQNLAQLGETLVKYGRKLETPEENLSELQERAEAFLAREAALLKGHKII